MKPLTSNWLAHMKDEFFLTPGKKVAPPVLRKLFFLNKKSAKLHLLQYFFVLLAGAKLHLVTQRSLLLVIGGEIR